MNYNVRLNLLGLKSNYLTDAEINGETVKCLVLPLKDNDLYIGEKGLYLDCTAWELKNQKDEPGYNTHLIKQSFDKETYKALSDEQKKEIPIIGGLTPFKETMQFEAKIIETDIKI